MTIRFYQKHMTDKKDNNKWINIIGIISVILIIYSWYYTYETLKSKDLNDRGTFGDMFGSINALYSGLAFAGIIFTILLQRKELKYQRQELRETRKEFEIQNKTLKLQRFESTFFNLLSLHHQIVDSIDIDIQKQKKVENPASYNLKEIFNQKTEYERLILKSRDVFKYKFEELKFILKDVDEVSKVNIAYLEFYETVQTDFGHYFRNLYRLIKFVHETEFYSYEEIKVNSLSPNSTNQMNVYLTENFKTRYKYICMIRSQLSDYEILWIFYNGLSSNGFVKFKPLIEQYSILKNIQKSKLNSINLVYEYNSNAFKES